MKTGPDAGEARWDEDATTPDFMTSPAQGKFGHHVCYVCLHKLNFRIRAFRAISGVGIYQPRERLKRP